MKTYRIMTLIGLLMLATGWAAQAQALIEKASAVIGVSGTVFSVSHDPTTADTEVSTNRGEVKVSTGGVTQTVAPGYALRARRGQALATAVLHNRIAPQTIAR
jgi:hypothetical protein